MEIILLGIYCGFVWLIFIKLKLLPWTTPWKVAVAIFPVVVLAATIALLNIFAPTTTDVRVVKYVVPIVSQVRGRVIEVPVQNNRPVKKGDVLFRIDPVPYESEVHSLEAQLVSAEAKVGADRARLSESPGPPARRGSRASASCASNSTRRRTRWRRCRRRSNWRRKRVGAEHGARRGRRRESLRPGAGADQRHRADRADCRRRARPSSR